MGGVKPNKQNTIDEIVESIKIGTAYNESLAQTVTNWHISKRTFDRYWKIANEQHLERQQQLNKALEVVDIAGAVEVRKQGLKSKAERLMYLQKLVEDSECDLMEIEKAESRIYARKAIKDIQAEISKIEGEYAPTKIAATNKDGEDVPPTPQIVVYNSGPPMASNENEIEE